ncbi:hypothetical protein LOC67_13595 [Stieleria sp. JC731]|uniref:hypothetical protein n=1 Tax=Pirellulaceae TaxID=2691357 RepID=UPI001E57055A|nr:hypothetical protein [Stieleria sp. JC731]MCC9601586.1 hypothetical protein [Stieleria sp. JC731]
MSKDSVELARFRIRFARSIRVATVGAFALASLPLIGCRGRAQDDYYRQKLTNQIRVLEDQLYDADYQNRVLQDKLEHARSVNGLPYEDPSAFELQDRPLPAIPEPVPDYDVIDLDSPDSENAIEDPSAVQERPQSESPGTTLPMPSSQSPDEPAPLQDPDPIAEPATDPNPPTQQDDPESTANDTTGGLGLPTETVPMPIPDPDTNDELLPPPLGTGEQLLPPTEDQLQDDQIIPGTPKPPAEDPSTPPGKIVFPADLKKMSFEQEIEVPVPDRLQIHPTLSGGHQTDEDTPLDGLYLVVNAVDASGNTLSLDNYDIDAELNVVVLDPLDESDDPRLGRWDFTPDEVRKLVHASPNRGQSDETSNNGFHIPIEWLDRVPIGDDVIVHVRLKAAEEEMRCQQQLRMSDSVTTSSWLPRG